MKREEALIFLKKNLQNKNLFNHSLAVEAAMIGLAKHFDEDIGKWGLAGLLHDIDYEETKDDPGRHGLKSLEILKECNLAEDILNAISSHNEMTGVSKQTLMAKALFCVDQLTGLIVASTLVLPSKKIEALQVKSVLNKFKEKSFAKGAKRENILLCETDLNTKVEDFVLITLKAMQGISAEIGL